MKSGVNMAGIGDEWQEGEGKHQTFLLRCWQETDCLSGEELEGFHNWNFALVQLNGPSQTKCFPSLEELVVHLRGRLSQAAKDDAESSADMLNHFEQRKR